MIILSLDVLVLDLLFLLDSVGGRVVLPGSPVDGDGAFEVVEC